MTAILTSPQLSSLVETIKEELRVSYGLLTSTLKDWNIDYVPVKAGIMILVRIAADAKVHNRISHFPFSQEVPCRSEPFLSPPFPTEQYLSSLKTFYQNAQEELAVLVKLRDEGVLISPGGGYLCSYGEYGWARLTFYGWARLTFAVKREVMVEALDRMKKVPWPSPIV
ncbi:hypothetical protein BPOR_0264g00100 [Botrytis porri]|uniref:Aminotransferase class I/classII domain-containing protein n=2 Tax=Botrytis porri TaxID=87229 RepID=A0A4Z1KQM8_9HELO|nr:hypothetical protein BPOR_0264g00100 [Botrytis porri]